MYRGKGAKQIAAEIEANDLAREILEKAESKEAEEAEELEGEGEGEEEEDDEEEDEEDSSKIVEDHSVTFSNVRHSNVRVDTGRHGEGQEEAEMRTYGMDTGSTLYDSRVTVDTRTSMPLHSAISSPSSDAGVDVGACAVTAVSRNGSQREDATKFNEDLGPELSSLPLSLPYSALKSGISELRNDKLNFQIGREEERKGNKDDDNDEDVDTIAPVIGVNQICKSSSSLMYVPLSVSPSVASAMSFADYQNDDNRDCGPESGISFGETSIIRNRIENNNEIDGGAADEMRICIDPLGTCADRVKRKYDDIGSLAPHDHSCNRSDVSVNMNKNNANNTHIPHKIMVDLISSSQGSINITDIHSSSKILRDI